jgi:hypothetical protein
MLASEGMPLQTVLFFESTEEIFARVFAEVRPQDKGPILHVCFRRYANANSSIRMREGRVEVKLPDVLEGAPAPIREALAWILVSKMFRRKPPAVYIQRYRLYMNRNDIRRQLHLVRQIRGRKFVSGPQGHRFNLEELFAELNERFFHGLMAQPLLGWSRRASRTLLGHYDPSHNAIILSRLLDGPDTPRLAVEYVLYHEMLHLQFPVEHGGARRCVHTRDFKVAERRFAQLKEAKEALKHL